MAGILITGATGCLGAEVTRQLLAQGERVTALGRNPAYGAALEQAGARFVSLDLCDPRPLEAHLQGVHSLYHCAALSSAWGSPQAFRAINVTATRRLLAAARAAGVQRFVFASSPSIYADGSDRLNLREDAPLPVRFATAYAQTKAEAEALVLAEDQPGAMRCIALRPRAIYGRGDRSLMPRLLQAMRRGRVPLIGGGRALIDVTHVTDAARAMICAAAAAEQAGGRAFNITSGQAWRFSDLLDQACALFSLNPKRKALPYGLAMAAATGLEWGHKLLCPKVEPVLTRQAVVSLGRSLTLDIAAARSALGYEPQIGLDQGLRDYAA